MKILVANIGSTSFKYRLFDLDAAAVLGQGRFERIGQPGGSCPDYSSAIESCLADLTGPGKPLGELSDLNAVGFKAVHAGPLSGARLVDEALLAAMEEYAFLAPAHNPPYIKAMRAFGQIIPSVPLVALFETAFFDQMDEAALTFSIPYEWKERFGIRRYGFHGASHRAASERVRELLGTGLRHISCHLGGSSSMAAIRDGVAVETSFGMSPQSGLPHNNRTGDLDVFAVLYAMKKLSLGVDEVAGILSSRSGLAGVSGTSGDVRDLSDGAAAGNARCRLALDMFVHSIRHYLGAFLVELGGLDVLSFTGGIGENSAGIRAAVCRNLEEFGLELDRDQNEAARGEAWVHRSGARVRILVLPADEERIVARAAAEVVARSSSKIVQTPS
jgi:acetate kinase